MSLEAESFDDKIVEVRYFDQTGSFNIKQPVYKHRNLIDEYHSVNGVPLDEYEIDSDDEEIIEYLL